MAQEKPVGNIKIGIGLDGTQFGNTLDEINAKVRQAESNMRTNLKAYGDAGKSYEALNQKTKDLTSTMGAQEAKIKELQKRREEAIQKYGEESKQVTNLNTQINNATGKYNGLSNQLQATKKDLAYASTEVNSLTKEMKENERETKNQAKALRDAGDEAGAMKVEQKGLEKQLDLVKRATKEQEKVVEALASEFGHTAKETEEAKTKLKSFGKQTEIAEKQLGSFKDKGKEATEGFSRGIVESGGHTDSFKGKVQALGGIIAGAFSVNVLKNWGQNLVETSADVEASYAKFEQLFGEDQGTANKHLDNIAEYAGVKQGQVRDAFSDMVAYLKSMGMTDNEAMESAERLIKTSADRSAFENKSLQEVMDSALSYTKGNFANDANLGFASTEATRDQQALALYNKAFKDLTETEKAYVAINTQEKTNENSKVTGQALREAGEYEPTLARLQQNWKELRAELGKDLLPFVIKNLEKLGQVLENIDVPKELGKVKERLGELKGTFDSVKDVVATMAGSFVALKTAMAIKDTVTGVTGAWKAYKLANEGATVAQWLFNTALSANPIGLAVVAIGVLAGAFVLAYKNIEPFRELVDKLVGKFKEFGEKVYLEYVKPAMDEVVRTFESAGKILSEWWGQNGEPLMQAIKNAFEVLKLFIGPPLEVIRGLFSSFFGTLQGLITTSWDTIKGIFSGAFTAIGGLIKVFTGVFTGDFEKVMDGVKDIFKGGWNVIASGTEGFANGMLKMIAGLSNGLKNGVLGAVNGIIKAINKLLKFFDQSGIKEISWGDWKAPTVKLPRFEKGTNGVAQDTLAVVNDQKGATYKEMIIEPNGRSYIPEGRDVVLPLRKGTQVVPAGMTKAMLPHFAKGTGFLANIWGNIKDFSGDVLDYMTKPAELVKSLFKQFVNLDGLGGGALDIAGGLVKKVTGLATDWVKGMFDSMGPGSFDGSMAGNNVYQYLVTIANKLMEKFGNMRITSGYREGDPYYHGRHQAIDIAFPSSMNGSPKNKEVANYAFDKFKKEIAYVITNGQVRDRMGISGQGKSGKWVPWPDNDHYDHIHLNGALGAGDIAKAGKGSSNWRNEIIRASKLMKANASSSEVDGIMSQIQRESSGNQTITQSAGVWDINMANGNPAKGLLQYIPSTFNAYKVKGYGNILSGFDQLMAFFNNSNWRRDLPYGRSGWGPSGVKRYENGGFISQEHMALVGERNLPEVVIPLSKAKRSRAMHLLAKTKEVLGDNEGSVFVVDNAGSSDSKIVELLTQQNNLLMQLLTKETNLYLDASKMNKKLKEVDYKAKVDKRRGLGRVVLA